MEVFFLYFSNALQNVFLNKAPSKSLSKTPGLGGSATRGNPGELTSLWNDHTFSCFPGSIVEEMTAAEKRSTGREPTCPRERRLGEEGRDWFSEDLGSPALGPIPT